MALDTATDRLSVAVGTNPADALEEDVPGARRHAGALVPVLDRLLARRGLGVADLAGVVLSDGPGSFTGLRVGASVAKALARARGLPVRSAPSLMVRAAGVALPGAPPGDVTQGGAIVLALSNALRGEVYAAAFRISPARIETLLQPSVFRPEALVAVAPRPDHVVGDGPPAALELVAAWAGRPVIGAPAGLPRAAVLLGLIGIEGGARLVADVERWEPVYGRPAEAQARWELAHGRRLADSAGGAG
ncbi:MAG TPA: tRNA (adenosine(37)-N6)-threonylcarbamoyltransferase complex dimerization subunit type 1 TsaB [Gemmatimonadales bacterium]|nr:tRNA (adenosine(37)-N6)-threonylcarbamoyltransferase complex dimerization subunit type 1 TsaB [Gemmatimonadales bacterium]